MCDFFKVGWNGAGERTLPGENIRSIMATPGDKYQEHEETHQEESLAISAVLEAMGFNAEIRNVIRTIMPLFIEITSIIKGRETVGIDSRIIGSVGEGLIMLALKSGTTCDADLIRILSDYEAREGNDTCSPQNRFQFWIESCERNTGYVKLRIANDKTLRQLESSIVEYDAERKTHYISNAAVITNDLQCELNLMKDTAIMMDRIVCGPSFSIVSRENFKPGMPGIDKLDVVISIPCPKWPSVAEEWIKRKRNYGWPPRDFISEHEKKGCYVVPVGCKECDRSHLDWRLSFVLVEQALVWKFNSTQLHCFILIKHLKKCVFEKEIGDIISSYILKTIVFWVIEESPPELWVPHRLLTAVQVCLDRLIECVQHDCCPNYFVRTCNLLTNRYSTTEKPIVLRACYFVRKDTIKLLTQTQLVNNAFGSNRFQRSIMNHMNIILKSYLGVVSSHWTKPIKSAIISCFTKISSCQESLKTAIEYCSKTSDRLKGRCMRDSLSQQIIPGIITEVELIRRRLLWTRAILDEEIKPNVFCITVPQKRLMETDILMENINICHMNVAAGNFHLTNDMLKPLIFKLKHLPLVRFPTHIPMQPLIACDSLMNDCFKYVCNSFQNGQHISDIALFEFEKDVIPGPLQKELLLQKNEQFYTSTVRKQNLTVDPVVFACFLKFWCSMKLEMNIDMLKARDDMLWCCNLPDITNKAVAFNLLGYCHKQLEEYEAAFGAFNKALQQSPESDATLVHMASLINCRVKRQLMETRMDS